VEDAVSRRQAIVLGLTALGGLGVGYLARTPEAGKNYLDLQFANQKISQLGKTPIASGGGVSLLGPFQGINGDQVWLRSLFSFSPNYVMCSVEDNPKGFIFPTATMGNVQLDPHSFFMFMGGSKVEKVDFSEASGHKTVEIQGSLDCHTQMLTASGSFGGRDFSEPAAFVAKAVDGQDFEISVTFDKNKAPVNNAVFGNQFTFKGQISDANITVTSVAGMTATSGGGGEG
jgi:hypothetical protein